MENRRDDSPPGSLTVRKRRSLWQSRIFLSNTTQKTLLTLLVVRWIMMRMLEMLMRMVIIELKSN